MVKAARTKELRIPVNKREDIITNKASAIDRPAQRLSDEQRARFRRPMKRRASKIIFFVDGSAPTTDEYEAAMELGTNVVFRNARKIVAGAPLENCDAVAGEVPSDYADVFPRAEADHEIDPDEVPFNIVSRSERMHPATSGNAPDDVRPGTVDTGHAHASGTGSSQPGVTGAKPKGEWSAPTNADEATALAEKQRNADAAKAAWKTGAIDK